MIIGFVNPPDIKDLMSDAAGREIRPLPKTEEELNALIKKAEAGDKEAQFDLGFFYRAQADSKLEYFRNTILSGSPNMRAPYNIGEKPPFFEVVEEDRRNAFIWFQKSAEQGDIDAVYFLSRCYERGEGTAQHPGKSRELLQKAAELGHMEAQYDLGMLYYHGVKSPGAQTFEFPQDYGRAVIWLTKAAEQGDTLAKFYLAQCYEEGTGVKKDLAKAFCWYKSAAESDCQIPWVLSKLAECYENGIGVEIDVDKAIEWYQTAADNGDEQAFDALDRLKD